MESPEFKAAVLDTLTEHIVVIDKTGSIVYVNQAWKDFATRNACKPVEWPEENYLTQCDRSAERGDRHGLLAAKGIRRVIQGERPKFSLEYPCHSPEELRWFLMRVSRFRIGGQTFSVIAHQNVTARKLAEERTRGLTRLDGLTGIANRRYMDKFLNQEWRRSVRLQQPISLALIDIDYFKVINDSHGHLAGDEVLRRLSRLLDSFARRPGDLAARYGGEEFALILGDTKSDVALERLNELMAAVRALAGSDGDTPGLRSLSVSIGLAILRPARGDKAEALIELADRRLYLAKEAGRDCLKSE